MGPLYLPPEVPRSKHSCALALAGLLITMAAGFGIVALLAAIAIRFSGAHT